MKDDSMTSEWTDRRNSEFMKRARAGDFKGAHLALERHAVDSEMSEATLAGWKAHLHHIEGNIDDATRVLAAHILVDDIPGKFLRHHRARILLWSGRLDEARADLEALLHDNHPRIEALHSGCRVQLAYIFALWGDPRFQVTFDAIPDGRDYFIKDSIVGKNELQRLYRANCKSRA